VLRMLQRGWPGVRAEQARPRGLRLRARWFKSRSHGQRLTRRCGAG